jgi:thiol-disulfide isomerase/thioredoxin
MKLKLCFLLLLCPIFWAVAQERNTNYNIALAVGNRVPEIAVSPVINYPSKELRIADFKGKLVILDFWASYCTPCLHLLPGFVALQTALPEKVQFILVTAQNSNTAATSLERLHINLPCVTSDEFLYKIFPHTSIPHEVWIWDGKVIATTYGEAVTKEAILKAAGGETPGMEQKQDDLSFDAMKPLLVNGNGGGGRVFYQSLITPYIAGLNTATGYQRTDSGTIAFALNSTAISLYQQAYSHKDPLLLMNNRMVIEVPDSLKQKLALPSGTPFHSWVKKYGFCYDLTLPPNFAGDLSRLMVSDLNRFFAGYYKLSATLEKRKTTCLVLSRISNAKSVESTGGTPIFITDSQHFVLHNLPIGNFTWLLANQHRKLSTPIIDETGYTQPVDITIDADTGDLGTLKKALTKSGLRLEQTKRSIEMVVLHSTDPIQISPK